MIPNFPVVLPPGQLLVFPGQRVLAPAPTGVYGLGVDFHITTVSKVAQVDEETWVITTAHGVTVNPAMCLFEPLNAWHGPDLVPKGD